MQAQLAQFCCQLCRALQPRGGARHHDASKIRYTLLIDHSGNCISDWRHHCVQQSHLSACLQHQQGLDPHICTSHDRPIAIKQRGCAHELCGACAAAEPPQCLQDRPCGMTAASSALSALPLVSCQSEVNPSSAISESATAQSEQAGKAWACTARLKSMSKKHERL